MGIPAFFITPYSKSGYSVQLHADINDKIVTFTGEETIDSEGPMSTFVVIGTVFTPTPGQTYGFKLRDAYRNKNVDFTADFQSFSPDHKSMTFNNAVYRIVSTSPIGSVDVYGPTLDFYGPK